MHLVTLQHHHILSLSKLFSRSSYVTLFSRTSSHHYASAISPSPSTLVGLLDSFLWVLFSTAVWLFFLSKYDGSAHRPTFSQGGLGCSTYQISVAQPVLSRFWQTRGGTSLNGLSQPILSSLIELRFSTQSNIIHFFIASPVKKIML